MAINQKDIKLLWGRAASRCSFPKCKTKLSESSTITGDAFVIGEQAHIIGEKDDAPRGKSILTVDERNSYPSLILLCPTHHEIIDKNESDYPAERLYLFKSEHELWVEENLSKLNDSKALAENLIYSDLIDTVSTFSDFGNWNEWVSLLISVNPSWLYDNHKKLEIVRSKIFKAAWPGTINELERSLKTFNYVIGALIQVYDIHSELDDRNNEYLVADKFYKARGQWNNNYHKDFEEYKMWEKKVTDLAIEATRAANWICDVVRKEINPLFFAKEGKFTVSYGPLPDLSYQTLLPEYTNEQKMELPDLFLNSELSKVDKKDIIDF